MRPKQRALETVLDDELAIKPVKAEARWEREEILEFLRKNSWRTRDNAGRCVRAVAVAIKRFHARLAEAVDAEGRPHPVFQGFARHLQEHLLIPSGRGGGKLVGGGVLYLRAAAGGRLECGVRNERNIQHPTSNIQHPEKGEGGV